MQWKFEHFALLESTNETAREHAPGSVIVAEVQTAGRGRMGRHWYSAKGGLWCSFIIDPREYAQGWRSLPLVAGAALHSMLHAKGLDKARLRWPNDLLIGRSKLAGILVEAPAADKAIIGIGVNISNQLDSVAANLHDPPISLAQLIKPVPEPVVFLQQLAAVLAQKLEVYAREGLSGLADELQLAWQGEREVEIEMGQHSRRGTFVGVDDAGNPVLRDVTTKIAAVSGAHITRLREL